MASIRTAAIGAGHWLMSHASGPGTWLRSAGSQTIPKSYPWNWWQKDMPLPSISMRTFGPIYTCRAIISQDLSRIPIEHFRDEGNNNHVKVTNKATARLFRKPNKYQTRSDLILYLMDSLLGDGNAYAIVGGRNERNEITSLYPINPKMIWPFIEPESGEYFYRIGQDATTEIAAWNPADVWLPPRDVLHIRLFTPVNPLIGESPLVAATLPATVGQQINTHNASFFGNMSRPSGVLRHPGRLKESALERIKQRFMELTQHNATGEPVVLAEGMDWSQLQMTAVDADVAAFYRLSERQIFQIFRVPAFLGGDMEQATLTNVESLTRFYLQSCLGFYVDHLEEALTLFFDLPPNERIVFDLETALLRGDLKERMEAYGKGIQNAVLTPDEARAKEKLPPVEYGDKARAQQQLVPLSYGANLQPPTPGGASPASEPEPSAEDPDDDAGDDGDSKSLEQLERTVFMNYSALKRVIDA